MIECLLRVFDHLLVLCKFTINVLIIVVISLDIAYHLLYVMHLKLNAVICTIAIILHEFMLH
jgi:hypothetical protein